MEATEERSRGTGKHAGKGASPYQVLLNKTVTTTIRGREMSIEEAVQHWTFKDALAGKPKAIREVLAWIKETRGVAEAASAMIDQCHLGATVPPA